MTVLSYQHLDAIRVAEIEKIIPLLPKGARILDVGGGTGRQALELSRRGFGVTAIDLAWSNYRKSSYGLPSPVTTRLWRRSHVEQGDD